MATYHHGDLRAAVLSAAWELIESQGVARLSVREAARRAGVSHHAPYRHFADRDALLDALVIEGFEQLEKAIEQRTGRELGEAYVAFALERPQRFRLMFSRAGASADLQARFAGLFATLGTDAAAAGAAAWSLVHGLAALILEGRLENSEGLRAQGAGRDALRSRPPRRRLRLDACTGGGIACREGLPSIQGGDLGKLLLRSDRCRHCRRACRLRDRRPDRSAGVQHRGRPRYLSCVRPRQTVVLKNGYPGETKQQFKEGRTLGLSMPAAHRYGIAMLGRGLRSAD
jgi:AcrR family transcriptional regulator